MKNQYIEALNEGRQVVIIPAENMRDFDPCIFWQEKGMTYTYSVNMGTIARTEKELPKSQLANHFATMLSEGAYLYIRGIVD